MLLLQRNEASCSAVNLEGSSTLLNSVVAISTFFSFSASTAFKHLIVVLQQFCPDSTCTESTARLHVSNHFLLSRFQPLSINIGYNRSEVQITWNLKGFPKTKIVIPLLNWSTRRKFQTTTPIYILLRVQLNNTSKLTTKQILLESYTDYPVI